MIARERQFAALVSVSAALAAASAPAVMHAGVERAPFVLCGFLLTSLVAVTLPRGSAAVETRPSLHHAKRPGGLLPARATRDTTLYAHERETT